VTVVLDVGANAGQYASRLREDGYAGTIISFEPLRDAYGLLVAASADDPAWHTLNVAVGDEPGVATMNVSANSYSSSFLPIGNRTVDAAPEAAYIGVEDVNVTALDILTLPPGRKMLKADVQGAEPSVLRGARSLLSTVELVELEMCLVPMYEGQELAPAVCAMMRERGFVPVAVEASLTHPETGEILEIDGIFANRSHPAEPGR